MAPFHGPNVGSEGRRLVEVQGQGKGVKGSQTEPRRMKSHGTIPSRTWAMTRGSVKSKFLMFSSGTSK